MNTGVRAAAFVAVVACIAPCIAPNAARAQNQGNSVWDLYVGTRHVPSLLGGNSVLRGWVGSEIATIATRYGTTLIDGYQAHGSGERWFIVEALKNQQSQPNLLIATALGWEKHAGANASRPIRFFEFVSCFRSTSSKRSALLRKVQALAKVEDPGVELLDFGAVAFFGDADPAVKPLAGKTFVTIDADPLAASAFKALGLNVANFSSLLNIRNTSANGAYVSAIIIEEFELWNNKASQGMPANSVQAKWPWHVVINQAIGVAYPNPTLQAVSSSATDLAKQIGEFRTKFATLAQAAEKNLPNLGSQIPLPDAELKLLYAWEDMEIKNWVSNTANCPKCDRKAWEQLFDTECRSQRKITVSNAPVSRPDLVNDRGEE